MGWQITTPLCSYGVYGSKSGYSSNSAKSSSVITQSFVMVLSVSLPWLVGQ
ncbi:MAG: hypothetical protein KH313_10260 [Lachnospiraceae bacterium]|nr:hypothetical protein [Lachnospiraceae bacterium]